MSGIRLFFTACLLISAVIVAAAFGGTMRTRAMPAEAAAGMRIWKANQCEGCHTLYGQGGAFAPDLTHIFELRGDTYLTEFLVNPSAFHPGQRAMPRFDLTVSETDNLIAFLEWIGQQPEAETWPPRPIVVSGGASLGLPEAASDAGAATSDDPVARGAALFQSPPAICGTCHALVPDVVVVGPSLAGIATRAATRVEGQSAEAYIRNSIIHPSDYVVDGFLDVMQKNFGEVLTADQINDLIAFLMTLA